MVDGVEGGVGATLTDAHQVGRLGAVEEVGGGVGEEKGRFDAPDNLRPVSTAEGGIVAEFDVLAEAGDCPQMVCVRVVGGKETFPSGHPRKENITIADLGAQLLRKESFSMLRGCWCSVRRRCFWPQHQGHLATDYDPV